MLLFTGKFDPSDFFRAVWVPPEVKDKILEPLTSLEEKLGNAVSDEALKNAVIKAVENQFGVKIAPGEMTREERFGYQKQRSLAFKKTAEPKESIFTRIKSLFSKGG